MLFVYHFLWNVLGRCVVALFFALDPNLTCNFVTPQFDDKIANGEFLIERKDKFVSFDL